MGHRTLSQVVLRALLPGASLAAEGWVVKDSMVGVAFGLSSLPPPWSCGGRMSFRPIRFPLESGRECHSVLDIVNLYDNQNIEWPGGKPKTVQVAPIGAA